MRYRTPAEKHDFLLYYAAVLDREADTRSRQNVQWMRDGAARARCEAASIDLRPAQPSLFGEAA